VSLSIRCYSAVRQYPVRQHIDVVKSLQHVADSERSKFDLRYARSVRLNDLKSGNIVLIGAAAANLWVGFFHRHATLAKADPHNEFGPEDRLSKWSCLCPDKVITLIACRQ
jgi:hypothetical protein